MKKAELKVGSTYGRNKSPITRKIVGRTYNEWLNGYTIRYKSSRFKKEQSCMDSSFAAWADFEI